MNTKTMIEQHIFMLPLGQIFTSQDFVLYGRRPAIDNCMSNLAKDKLIRRLARGVFMLEDPRAEVPSIVDIARAKAAAYGKEIFLPRHPRAPDDSDTTVFLTNGQSSKFQTVRGPVELKRASPTRIKRQI